MMERDGRGRIEVGDDGAELDGWSRTDGVLEVSREGVAG
jgi:hypothetical protein